MNKRVEPPIPEPPTAVIREHSPVVLGQRIKMLRVALGMTLKELEQKGGISATHVSEIERGKASPTIGALGRIAQALGLRPAELVEPKELPDVTVRRAADRHAQTVMWGGVRIESLTEPTRDAMLSLHRFTLPISREPSLIHHHEGEEWVTALQGVAELRIDGQSHVLREGDSLHFRAHQRHSYANLGSGPAVLLVAGRPRLAL